MQVRLTAFEYELLAHVRKMNMLNLGSELTEMAQPIIDKGYVKKGCKGFWWLTDAGKQALEERETDGA